MKVKNLRNFHFALFLEKTKDNILKKKKQKIPCFWTLFIQIWAKRNVHKNRVPSLFSIYSFLTSCKKSEKTNEPILSKPTNQWTNDQTDEQTQMKS